MTARASGLARIVGQMLLAGWLTWSARAATVESVQPLHGLPGSAVVITGTGFNPAGSNSLTVGGQPATITGVTAGSITFLVPAGIAGGAVVVEADGQPIAWPVDFHVTRLLAGTFTPPAGVSRAGYEVAGFGDFGEVDADDGSFEVEVPLDRSAIVWAIEETGTRGFAAVVAPADAGVVIDADSTAVSLAFVMPQVGRRDPAAAVDVRAAIDGLAEKAPLAQAIAAHAAGADYLAHPQVVAARAALINAIPPVSPPGLQTNEVLTPSDLYLRDLNPDYSTAVPATPALLGSSLDPVADDPLARARFALDSGSPSNNADWLVELFQVNPASYPGGLADLDALQHFDRPPRLSLTPLATGVARTDLEGAKLDLVERAAKFVTGTSGDFGGYETRLGSAPPGVYVSHAYSGNLWYGTTAFLNNHQATLIDQLGGNARHAEAMAANLVVAAVDLASAAVPLDAIIAEPAAILDLLETITVDVTKTISIYTAAGQWDQATALDLLKTTAVAVVKGLIGLAVDAVEVSGQDQNIITRTIGRLGKLGAIAGNLLKGSVDIFGKISSVEQSMERASGILLPSSLAIERSVFVIGQPFGPIIDRFEPGRGRAGDHVVILGQNFPTSVANVSVSFCQYGATGNPPPLSVSLPATVLAANERSLVVRVPVGGQAAFAATGGLAFLCVENSAGQKADTRRLPPGRREFFFEPPPVPAQVVNSPLLPDSLMHVTGSGFSRNGRIPDAGIIDGDVNNPARVTHATDTDLLLILPQDTAPGPHQLALRYGEEAASVAIPFEVLPGLEDEPAHERGLEIFVYSLAMNTAADDVITLLEAMHLANGTLGRELTPEEQQLAAGSDQGRDTIYCYPSGTVPGGVLPAPTSGDSYYFNPGTLVIDGAAAAEDAVGWLLDGVEGVTLVGATFRNFAGGGIVIRNHANNNRVRDVRIEDCGLDGLAIEGDAENNFLTSLFIRRAARHGVRLEGGGVRYNEIRPNYVTFPMAEYSGADDCGSHGVLVTGGAQRNVVDPGFLRGNALAGVAITGAATDFNRIGRVDNSPLIRAEISGNGGPGVYLAPGVEHTVLAYLLCVENDGDGVLLEGPDCDFNHLDGIATSFRPGSPNYVPAPNLGSGIHLCDGASDNLIGTDRPSFNFPYNLFCADRDYNILIEGAGSDRNTINSAYFGRVTNIALTGTNGLLPAGLGGICIRDGSDGNTIGNRREDLSCQFWTWNGAGVAIDGAGSDGNRLLGNQFVLLSGLPRPVGIHLRNGTRGNVIGEAGNRIQVPSSPTMSSYFVDPRNRIHYCTDAGILIENSGGEVAPDGTVSGANLIRNNEMWRNGDGIRLGPGAWANEIGGPLKAHGNALASSFNALIRISGNVLPGPHFRNRIRHNTIGASLFLGGSLPEPPAPADGAHATGPVPMTGVLADGNSSGHWIGEDLAAPNQIQFNYAGVYLEGGADHVVRGNNFFGNFMAGVVVHGGSGHAVGGESIDQGNLLPRNGRNRVHEGGIVLSGGGGHRVVFNQVGSLTAVNQGVGLLALDSAANVIGGLPDTGRNEFIGSLSHGIRITGESSTGNQVAGNLIGIDRAFTSRPNGGHGILIDGGASDNLIGGTVIVTEGGIARQRPAGNQIQGNALAGVAVDGMTTLGNSILGNWITANSGAGISLTNGGNHALPPPAAAFFDPVALQITGNSPDLAKVPVDSRIQAFCDPDPAAPEGAILLGEGKVRSGGTFLIRLKARPVLRPISFTATHPVTGSTSPFGSGPLLQAGLEVARTDSTPATDLPAGGQRVTLLQLTFAALEADARIAALDVTASGSFPDDSALTAVEVFRDADESGTWTPADEALSEAHVFPADDGTLTLPLDGALVPAGSPARWILVGTLAPGAPLAATLRLEVTAAPDVDAYSLRPSGPVVAAGIFPIQSALHTVVAGATPQTFAAWAAEVFSPAQLADPDISGPLADHDGDGLNTFGEYAFGGDPLVPDRHLTAATGEVVSDGGDRFLEILHRRRTPPSDVDYAVQDSTAMTAWPPVPAGQLQQREVTPVGTEGKLERVRWRLLPGVTASPRRFARIEATPSP